MECSKNIRANYNLLQFTNKASSLLLLFSKSDSLECAEVFVVKRFSHAAKTSFFQARGKKRVTLRGQDWSI